MSKRGDARRAWRRRRRRPVGGPNVRSFRACQEREKHPTEARAFEFAPCCSLSATALLPALRCFVALSVSISRFSVSVIVVVFAFFFVFLCAHLSLLRAFFVCFACLPLVFACPSVFRCLVQRGRTVIPRGDRPTHRRRIPRVQVGQEGVWGRGSSLGFFKYIMKYSPLFCNCTDV